MTVPNVPKLVQNQTVWIIAAKHVRVQVNAIKPVSIRI